VVHRVTGTTATDDPLEAHQSICAEDKLPKDVTL
jgi:hypothetical protein